jgi:hypothetical protein
MVRDKAFLNESFLSMGCDGFQVIQNDLLTFVFVRVHPTEGGSAWVAGCAGGWWIKVG